MRDDGRECAGVDVGAGVGGCRSSSDTNVDLDVLVGRCSLGPVVPASSASESSSHLRALDTHQEPKSHEFGEE